MKIVFQVFPSFKFLPIGRSAGALLASVLTVIFGVLSPSEAYGSIDLSILGLLFATMLVSVYLQKADLFKYLGHLLSWKSRGGMDLLCRVCLLSAVSSAFFTNDTCCVILTGFILKICSQKNLHPKPFLIALATSANIGSAATPIGNPQNLVVAIKSHVSFGSFLIGLLPSVFVGVFLNTCLLLLAFGKRLSSSGGANVRDPMMRVQSNLDRLDQNEVSSTVVGIDDQFNKREDPTTSIPNLPIRRSVSSSSERLDATLESSLALEKGKKHIEILSHNDDVARLASLHDDSDKVSIEMVLPRSHVEGSSTSCHDAHEESCCLESDQSLHQMQDRICGTKGLSHSQHLDSAIKENHGTDGNRLASSSSSSSPSITMVSCSPDSTVTMEAAKKKWKRKLHKLAVYLVAAGMLAALLCGLDLSWTALTASVTLMVLDFCDASSNLQKVSYVLLVFFAGMFITIDGFNETGIPSTFWELVEPHARTNTASGVVVLSLVVIILANVASNVPTVLLLGSRIAESALRSGANVTRSWLILAWVSTIAGNLTLVGSAANLIVSEEAMKARFLGYELTFFSHLLFGFPSTLLVVAVGLPLIRG